jgi:hypothetical protein
MLEESDEPDNENYFEEFSSYRQVFRILRFPGSRKTNDIFCSRTYFKSLPETDLCISRLCSFMPFVSTETVNCIVN